MASWHIQKKQNKTKEQGEGVGQNLKKGAVNNIGGSS